MKTVALVVITLSLIQLSRGQRQLKKKCVYGLLESRSNIESGDRLKSPDNADISLEQHNNGNLVVKDGDNVLWESGVSGSIGDYFTRLQGDGNMLTHKGRVGDSKGRVWKTASQASGSTPYFLGVDCDLSYIGIYKGTPDAPGEWIWREGTWTSRTASNPAGASPKKDVVPFSFYVMGDVPYNAKEKENLPVQLTEMKKNLHPRAKFLVHVGDLQKVSETKCNKSHLQDVRMIFRENSPLPTFVLAGDNDYLDCPNKEDAWNNYVNEFVGFEKEWDGCPEVSRHREMFAFEEDHILFLSMTLMNMSSGKPDDLFRKRLADSKAWVKKQLYTHKNSDLRGIVMFGHAMISSDLRPFFQDELKAVFSAVGLENVPVLYICGDGHKFKIDKGIENWSKFNRLQVDNGGEADPLLVEIRPSGGWADAAREARSGKQYTVGNGMFRIDRQNGRY